MTAMDKEKHLLPQMDLVKVIAQLWSRKWTIILVAFLSGVLGFVLALDIPKRYQTVVTLAPESSESDLASAASSITSMLGISMGANGVDAIYPELYPDIINTIPFSVEMLGIQVCTMDSSYQGDLYHYLAYHQKSPWWSRAKMAVKKKFSKKSAGMPDVLDAYSISKKQMRLIESFHGDVTCDVDVKTSVITLTSEMQDKLVACTVADSLCRKLQEYITAYKTNKTRNELVSITGMFEEAKAEYIKAQLAYSQFVDKNVNLTRESSKAEAVRLENEMDIAYGIYQELANHMSMTRAKVLEQTPAFTILEPARLAEWHCAPKKSLRAILVAFIGGIIACLWVLVKKNNISISNFLTKAEEE